MLLKNIYLIENEFTRIEISRTFNVLLIGTEIGKIFSFLINPSFL